jgi:hypothetical protein
MKGTIFSIIACIILACLSGCSSHTNEALAVIDPKGPFQCERDGKQFDCISKKELERLIEAEKYWQNNMR